VNVQLKTIDESSLGQRLDNYLLKQLRGVSRSLIYRIIRTGEVRVNKERKKPNYRLEFNDKVRIPPVWLKKGINIEVSKQFSEYLFKQILYEDTDLLVLNKPSGLASHGGSGIDIGVIEALRQMYNNRLELVHRIDRATSGCLLIAKKRQSLLNLQQQLRRYQISKRYWALLHNTWQKKPHIIDAPLLKSNSGHQRVIVNNNGFEAHSCFHPLKNINHNQYQLCVAQVDIKTGRMHQIRAHAYYTGHPVIGDQKYGDYVINKKMQKYGIKRLCLHAQHLGFIHPTTGGMVKIIAPVSEDLLTCITAL
jgi:23S rRNA pseudouridine955/2504/2580 synthase